MPHTKKEPDKMLDVGVGVSGFDATHPAWIRLEDQIQWYDTKSIHSQFMYKWLKVTQVSLALLVPVMSLLPNEIVRWATALSGVAIALLEGVQQMNQYSTLWVSYRSTAERLKHEKFLFLSHAGPYRGLIGDDLPVQLAERVEEHVSSEHANWFKETKPAQRSQAATAK
jgi:hypothetical protein